MIAQLYGTIQPLPSWDDGDDLLLLTGGGVAYRFACSATSRQKLLAANDGQAMVLTELMVREDRWLLYGFSDGAEQAAFRLLTNVQGVGGKVALALLSALPPAQLQQAILGKNVKALQKADGVGARLAERLITELKDRLAKHPLTDSYGLADYDGLDTTANGDDPAAQAIDNPLLQDACQALIQLGYSRVEALGALSQVGERPTPPTTLAGLLTAALQQLASGHAANSHSAGGALS
ncbi:MAG: Holliday junction branch migration protein RuvA [Alphaproteobacteria bacterium]|nr:Holliday junction branch migration protein RuvA [Alphaproteobacteria bacterium]